MILCLDHLWPGYHSSWLAFGLERVTVSGDWLSQLWISVIMIIEAPSLFELHKFTGLLENLLYNRFL